MMCSEIFILSFFLTFLVLYTSQSMVQQYKNGARYNTNYNFDSKVRLKLNFDNTERDEEEDLDIRTKPTSLSVEKSRILLLSSLDKKLDPISQNLKFSISDDLINRMGDGDSMDQGSSTYEKLLDFLPSCPNSYLISMSHKVLETDRKKGLYYRSKYTELFGTDFLSDRQLSICSRNKQIKVQDCWSNDNTICKLKTSDLENGYTVTEITQSNPVDEAILRFPGTKFEASTNTDSRDDCVPKSCPLNQFMAINTKNPFDCYSFYICIMGQHFLLHCPTGYQFSEEYGVCLEEKYVTCSVNAKCIQNNKNAR